MMNLDILFFTGCINTLFNRFIKMHILDSNLTVIIKIVSSIELCEIIYFYIGIILWNFY